MAFVIATIMATFSDRHCELYRVASVSDIKSLIL